MEVKLVVVGGRANQREIALKLPAVIGRSREANLTIGHSLVSRRHCLLHAVDGVVFVRDLNSTNGTFFEKRRIIEAPLLPDQHFSVGPLTFRIVYEFSGDASAIPPPQWAQQQSAAHPVEAPPAAASGPWSSEPAALDSRVLQVPISTTNSSLPNASSAAPSGDVVAAPAEGRLAGDQPSITQPDEPPAEEIEFEFVDDSADAPPENKEPAGISSPAVSPAEGSPVWPPSLPNGVRPPSSPHNPPLDELTLDDFLADEDEADPHGARPSP